MIIPAQRGLSAESEKVNQLRVLPPGRRLFPMGRRLRLERSPAARDASTGGKKISTQYGDFIVSGEITFTSQIAKIKRRFVIHAVHRIVLNALLIFLAISTFFFHFH
jgi:hypothetical protein